jgi:hypothetical protein
MINPQIKKILIITAGILSIVIIGLIIYIYISSRQPKEEVTEETSQENTEVSRIATKVGDKQIVNATIDDTNAIKYYELNTGNVYQIPASGGESTILDDTTLTNLTSVEWAPSSPYVLTNINNRIYSYNFATQKSYSFPIDVTSAQFLSDNRVMYTFQDSSGLVDLSVSNADGSNWKKIITLTSNAVFLKPMPFQNTISQTLIPSSYRASALRVINIETGEAKSVLEEKTGLNVSWAPNGEIGIISYTTERGGGNLALSIIDKSGFEISRLPEPGTIAEKIAWSKDGTVAYFTKPEVPNTKIMPDDYYGSNLGDFQESLYRIDIATKTITKLSSNIGNVDSRDLFLNSAGTELFFVNKRDNQLYKVNVK